MTTTRTLKWWDSYVMKDTACSRCAAEIFPPDDVVVCEVTGSANAGFVFCMACDESDLDQFVDLALEDAA